MIECIGDKRKVNGVKNPYWNCDIGPFCSNRSLSQRKYSKCKPKREQGKGWGLIAVNRIKRGELVQEYTGEVIDEKTKEARLQEWAQEHPNDPNFYIMQLETGWYIDARKEANLSRFINHSCDPNCVLRQVNVNGYMRIGIFAKHDIAPGEFLCYDYQFDTKQGDRFVCRCGSHNCRGTMKGGKPEQTEKKASPWQEAKAKYEKDKRFLEDAKKKEAQRFSQVDGLVPGAEMPHETVASGPQVRYRDDAIVHRVFLWRNVLLGGEFARRAKRLKHANRSRCQHNAPEPLGNLDVFSAIEEIHANAGKKRAIVK